VKSKMQLQIHITSQKKEEKIIGMVERIIELQKQITWN